MELSVKAGMPGGLYLPNVDRAVYEVRHVLSRSNRKGVLSRAASGRDDASHFPGRLALLVGALRKHSDQQVLERKHADAEEHKLGVRHVWYIWMHLLSRGRDSPAFVVPPGKRTRAIGSRHQFVLMSAASIAREALIRSQRR